MIVAVAGLIGAGKSTLVETFENKNKYTVFKEPVGCNPFLKLYYDDPCRWSYTLQIYYLWERYKQVQEAYYRSLRNETVVLDSTIYSDMAFALLQKNAGYFTEDEFKSYKDMHEIVAKQTAYPDVLLWLDLSAEKTLERINNRSRECESNIPLNYLKDLRQSYDKVFEKLRKRTDIVTVDATADANTVYESANKIINSYIERFNKNDIDYV